MHIDTTSTVACMHMAEKLSSKVVEYERFLNERLRTDLRYVLERKDRNSDEIAEFLQLKATIQHLMTIPKVKQEAHWQQVTPASAQQKSVPLKTMVDLGCNFYAKARVRDYSRIIVSIGLGFYLEMELREAVEYVDKRVERLTVEADKLSEEASQINARIKVVLGALDELQFKPSAQRTPSNLC